MARSHAPPRGIAGVRALGHASDQGTTIVSEGALLSLRDVTFTNNALRWTGPGPLSFGEVLVDTSANVSVAGVAFDTADDEVQDFTVWVNTSWAFVEGGPARYELFPDRYKTQMLPLSALPPDNRFLSLADTELQRIRTVRAARCSRMMSPPKRSLMTFAAKDESVHAWRLPSSKWGPCGLKRRSSMHGLRGRVCAGAGVGTTR